MPLELERLVQDEPQVRGGSSSVPLHVTLKLLLLVVQALRACSKGGASCVRRGKKGAYSTKGGSGQGRT